VGPAFDGRILACVAAFPDLGLKARLSDIMESTRVTYAENISTLHDRRYSRA